MVRSSRRSGTMQAACGLWASAMVEHFLGRRHLEVQRQIDLGHQPVDVGVRDMAPVLAQMRGDPVGSRLGGDMRRADRIGMIAAARVPDGRDMVDIDAEAEPLVKLPRGSRV